MKILFIKNAVNSSYSTYDAGIGALIAMTEKNGDQADLFIIKSLNDLSLLNQKITLSKPDIIGFSVLASSLQSSIKISSWIKKRHPHILQIMGGVHFILN